VTVAFWFYHFILRHLVHDVQPQQDNVPMNDPPPQLRKRTLAVCNASNKSKNPAFVFYWDLIEVATEFFAGFFRSKSELRHSKSSHKQYLMPNLRYFNACKSTILP
jgi:hypothetical protein